MEDTIKTELCPCDDPAWSNGYCFDCNVLLTGIRVWRSAASYKLICTYWRIPIDVDSLLYLEGFAASPIHQTSKEQ